jgi:inositol transport system substrate-binding protein
VKKTLLWLIVVTIIAVFSLAGCSEAASKTTETVEPAAEEPVAEAPAEEEPAAEEADNDYFVAYIAKNTVDVFQNTLNSAAGLYLDELVASGDIGSWQLFDGLTDPVTQVGLVDDAINMGADIVVMMPCEAAGCVPCVTKCVEADIPIVLFSVKTDNWELANAYIGRDDIQIGEMVAEFVREQIPGGGGWAHLQGVIGNTAQIDRGTGMHNVMDKDENWTLLDEQTAEWQGEKAMKFAEDWLTKYGDDLNAILCDNDQMSSAAQSVMNAADRSDVICIGVDGNPGPMEMIKNGELLATVKQDGEGMMRETVKIANLILQGKEVPKETVIDAILVTQDNIDDHL